MRLYSLFLNRSEIIKILNNFPDIENGDKDKSEFTVEILENLVDVFGIDSNDSLIFFKKFHLKKYSK